jgi:type II secretory ATPase GspE/PulE/Tfp pilus assembly ATPase PilB-like protein
MAQRLVRKLCDKCKKERAATGEEQAFIDRHISQVVDKNLLPQKQNVVYEAAAEGCSECHGRGYKGRIGIFEAIFMDQKIEEILRTKPSEREIAAAAREQGIPTMQQDGILKVLRGITSLEELRRVVDLD